MIYPNIEAERARSGLSLETLASKLGVTRKTLYNWMEKGDIPQQKLEKMADLFDCSTDYLLGFTPDATCTGTHGTALAPDDGR